MLNITCSEVYRNECRFFSPQNDSKTRHAKTELQSDVNLRRGWSPHDCRATSPVHGQQRSDDQMVGITDPDTHYRGSGSGCPDIPLCPGLGRAQCFSWFSHRWSPVFAFCRTIRKRAHVRIHFAVGGRVDVGHDSNKIKST